MGKQVFEDFSSVLLLSPKIDGNICIFCNCCCCCGGIYVALKLRRESHTCAASLSTRSSTAFVRKKSRCCLICSEETDGGGGGGGDCSSYYCNFRFRMIEAEISCLNLRDIFTGCMSSSSRAKTDEASRA